MKRFLTLHTPREAALYRDRGWWREDTFYGLLARHAEDTPDALALCDGQRRLTWAELRAWVDGVALDMRTYGLEQGDRVGIWMGNRVEAVVTFLACSREGFACNPSLHRTYTCGEVADLLKRLSVKALVTEPGWGSDHDRTDLSVLLSCIASLRIVYTPDAFPRAASNITPVCADPDKIAYLAFTSGTTGQAKCVMHSDNTLLANARELVRDWGHDRDTVILSLSPLSHHIAWVAVGQWLLTGCRLVTDAPPRHLSRLDWVVASGATYVLGVPTHAADLLREQRERGQATMGAVRTFYMAGSAIPEALPTALMAQGIMPQNVYGMTECSSHQYTHPGDDPHILTATCGCGGNAYGIRIFDTVDPNLEVRPGEIGQIGGRGAALMLGYFGDQAATEHSFNSEGWFLSGDLGVVDANGNLRVAGRLKDLINRGGHSIIPLQIETLAAQCPGVAAIACFPVPDERLGERGCMAIVGTAKPDAIVAHLQRAGLSRFDMPEYYVRLAELPFNDSGKVLKRVLEEQVRDGTLAPIPIRRPARGGEQPQNEVKHGEAA